MISACERLAWREAEGTPFVGMPNLLAALGGRRLRNLQPPAGNELCKL